MENRTGKRGFVEKQLTETDRNGKLAGALAPIANWASDESNRMTRPLMETDGRRRPRSRPAEIPRQDLRRRAPG